MTHNKPTFSFNVFIKGQEFSSRNNTQQEIWNLVRMVRKFGGWVVAITEESQ